jgi:hypothetical protein
MPRLRERVELVGNKTIKEVYTYLLEVRFLLKSDDTWADGYY